MAETPPTHVDLEKLVSLCKRRGFVFQSSEIYGGMASTWDYGPLGAELKKNVKDSWWRTFVWGRDDVVGLDASILMHPDVWRASGHVASFSDPMVECRSCNQRFREDHLEGDGCPECDGELGEPRQFNLMFKTFVGPVEDQAAEAWLRPETAQGIFVNFDNVLTATRKRLPFGIAQIGKAFRNEITTGNFIFRTREFEAMEIEYFVMPGEDEEAHERWIVDCVGWYTGLGVNPERLRVRPHDADELSHYSKATHEHRVPVPVGLGRDPRGGEPDGLRPARAQRGERTDALVLRPAEPEAHRPIRDRACGWRRSLCDDVPGGRIHGGGGNVGGWQD